MATTTNYGWTTPDDTALVKDGAAAIRTLGSSVDTTTKALNPETTLGDLAYRSSTANVKTRLGLGTAGQVLQVNSGATAPEWATVASGGMTLISTTTLSGATVSLSSIPQTYKSLRVVVYGVLGQTSDAQIWCKVNNTTTGMYVSGVRAGSASQLQDLRVYLTVGDASNRTSSDNAWVFQFDKYNSILILLRSILLQIRRFFGRRFFQSLFETECCMLRCESKWCRRNETHTPSSTFLRPNCSRCPKIF
jgi:hypothetical protein